MQKLGGSAYMTNVFDEVGFGAWFRYAVGVVELVGAIGLLVPTFSGAAAIGLVVVALGGTITNAMIGENPVFPLVFLLLAIAVAWGRWPDTLALVRRRADRAGLAASALHLARRELLRGHVEARPRAPIHGCNRADEPGTPERSRR